MGAGDFNGGATIDGLLTPEEMLKVCCLHVWLPGVSPMFGAVLVVASCAVWRGVRVCVSRLRACLHACNAGQAHFWLHPPCAGVGQASVWVNTGPRRGQDALTAWSRFATEGRAWLVRLCVCVLRPRACLHAHNAGLAHFWLHPPCAGVGQAPEWVIKGPRQDFHDALPVWSRFATVGASSQHDQCVLVECP
jgi:hypothetical protein